jgi:hypothetical protein
MTDETDLSAFQIDSEPFVSAEHDGKTWVSHLFLAPIQDGAEGDNKTVLENCPRYFVYRAQQQGVTLDPEPLEITIQGTWPETPVFVQASFRILEEEK